MWFDLTRRSATYHLSGLLPLVQEKHTDIAAKFPDSQQASRFKEKH
jgi:hypothetical protein